MIIESLLNMDTKKIALVLSSGGARGIAHLGVIDVLEENGYEITSIIGCSMGAMVGGMYVAGHHNALKEWLFSLTITRMGLLADTDINTSYIVRGERLIKDMQKTMPDCSIEDCKIPFTAVASDVKSEKEVVFRSGSLYEAIRASISIPIFFKPIQRNNQLLMDGGVLNPFPLNYAQKKEDEIILGVNVTSFSNEEYPPHLNRSENVSKNEKNPFLLTKAKFFIPGAFAHQEAEAVGQLMIAKNSELMAQLYRPDIRLDLPASSYHCFDFFKAQEIYEKGREMTQNMLKQYFF